MIVYTHHSFVAKPPPPPPKVKICKPRDIEAERQKRRAYYQKHKGEIKNRRLRKEMSK